MYDPEKEIEQAESLEDLVRVLESLFNRGYAVDPEGRLYKILELVAQVKGLRIVIRPDEHPPPHFQNWGTLLPSLTNFDTLLSLGRDLSCPATRASTPRERSTT